MRPCLYIHKLTSYRSNIPTQMQFSPYTFHALFIFPTSCGITLHVQETLFSKKRIPNFDVHKDPYSAGDIERNRLVSM